MARIAPFAAVRPTRDKAHLVASRSYVSYSRSDLRDKLNGNPFTFIHVINPEFGKPVTTKPNSRQRFQKVRERYEAFIHEGVFLKDSQAAFYIYRQTQEKHAFTGIIAGVSIDDYLSGNIKVHEHTLTKREEVFTEYLDVCGFNAEPVLLTYEENDGIEAWMAGVTASRPEYEFSTTDRVKHELWPVSEGNSIAFIEQAFSSIENLYIADGHHRCASSARLGLACRKRNPGFTGQEGFNYIMAYLVPKSQMVIYPFHRMVVDLHNYSPQEILEQLEKSFEVENLSEPFLASHLHEFGLYMDHNWYRLTLRDVPAKSTSVANLDPHLLNVHALEPIWQIIDLKTDKRIAFKGGPLSATQVAREVDSGKFAAAFLLSPVPMEQLLDVADAGEIMPPKSTWVEPKLRSGLTIFQLHIP